MWLIEVVGAAGREPVVRGGLMDGAWQSRGEEWKGWVTLWKLATGGLPGPASHARLPDLGAVQRWTGAT